MSDQHWGPNPPQQPPADTAPRAQWPAPPPHQSPPGPPRQRRQFLVTKIAIGVAAGIALFIVGVIVLIGILIGGAASDKQASTGTRTNASQAADTPAATDAPASTGYTPTPSDFTLRAKTLSKECFGEAGCNVEYRVELAYDGPALDPDVTWEVTYQVSGPEDGAQIGTLTVTGDKYEQPGEEIASTASASTTLKVKVIEVAEQ